MRRYLLIAACIVLVALAVFGAYAWERAQAKAFFSNSLRQSSVEESVTIRGTEYSVSDGVVYEGNDVYHGSNELRAMELAYEEAWARRNPPFSLAGTDPTKLLAAVVQLKGLELQLASLQATSSDAALIGSSLYPIDFLTDAAHLEEERQTFLQEGTPQAANTYIAQIGVVETAYQTDLSQFRSAFETAVPKDVGDYAGAYDDVSRSSMIQAFSSLSDDGRSVSGRVTRLAWCVAGIVQWCDSSDIQLPALPVATSSELAGGQIAQAANIRALYVGAGLSLASTTVALAQSTCIDRTASPLFTVLDNELFWIGDARFVSSGSEANIPFFREFSQLGITYVPMSPLMYYECPNIGNDWGAAYATLAVARFAAQTPLSADATGSEAITLRSLERSLAGPVEYQQDAIKYLTAGESLAAQNVLPSPVQNSVIELALAMQDQSASFDALTSEVVRVEQTNVALTKEGISVDLGAAYLLYVRNAFAPFFFADNASVHPAGDLFTANKIPQAAQPYVFYSTLPRTETMTAQLTHDIRVYYAMHGQ